MRTVSFSEPQVQDLLNNQFVCAFTNTQGDPTAGGSIDHRPKDPAGDCVRGNGKQNVQTLFLTPAGEIFHVATGFLSERDLLAEIQFAGELFQSMRQSNAAPRSLVADAHRQRLAQLGFSQQEIDSENEFEAFLTMPGFTATAGGPQGFQFSQNPFQGFVRARVLADNQFSIRHPLWNWEALERDPTLLVGSGTSFFASSSSADGRDR